MVHRLNISSFRAVIILFALTAMLVAEVSEAQRGPSSVFVEPVTERNFSERIEALGTLAPNESVDLTLNVADRVTSLYLSLIHI